MLTLQKIDMQKQDKMQNFILTIFLTVVALISFMVRTNILMLVVGAGIITGFVLSKPILMIVSSVILLIILFFKFKSGAYKHAHLMNILHAKHTFDHLNEDQRNLVHTVAMQGLRDGGMSNPVERMRDFTDLQRYGIYALAMNDASIPSAIKGYRWVDIPNPIIIPEQIMQNIDAQIDLFEHQYKVILDIKKQ